MAPPGSEAKYEPTRFVRCPFDLPALRGVDMSLCVGFEADPVDDARGRRGFHAGVRAPPIRAASVT